MKCPHCYGIGEVLKESDDGIGWITKKCRWCNGTGEAEMTNEQWLRTATTEELAELLFHIFGQGVIFGETHDEVPMFPDDEVITESVFNWWLHEKHET